MHQFRYQIFTTVEYRVEILFLKVNTELCGRKDLGPIKKCCQVARDEKYTFFPYQTSILFVSKENRKLTETKKKKEKKKDRTGSYEEV